MISMHKEGVFLYGGKPCKTGAEPGEARKKTITYGILRAHDCSESKDKVSVRFDSLISHDITYVSIVQTAVASGMKKFPVPYVLTNCHNSLCAIGGTINEDDHMFGLSAAKKYGGIYVPANTAVIHQYAREEMAFCGGMILGSDSHTRYGALGCMGVGEGGPELVRQLLGDTWDSPAPEVVLVYVTGNLPRGVGPHDVAIALCGAVYKNGFVKNKVLEFVGPGLAGLSMDYRIGIDVMTTETACLSSVWATDDAVKEYYETHCRADAFSPLSPDDGAWYDSYIELDLSTIEPMAALPFHPSEAYTLRELIENAGDILPRYGLESKLKSGKIIVDQGIIAGCAGGMFDNIAEAASILSSGSCPNGEFSLSVYPPSLPVQQEVFASGLASSLSAAGAILKPCFCGPCFGAGDVPANGALSIRHTTRNFPNREGARPADGQKAFVMLMDARSIAATALNGGVLASAADIDYDLPSFDRGYDRRGYDSRVYYGFGSPDASSELRYGPNIQPWPQIPAMPENLEMELASVIHDEVTTTDELIPSGETSSYRSNPIKLADFALSRRDPEYVGRAKDIRSRNLFSCIYANCPGDGSAREQASSCQRVLGGGANISRRYATKRYRSNLINWGILPFTIDEEVPFDYSPGDRISVPGIRAAVESGTDDIKGYINGNEITFHLGDLTAQEREILLAGCLMNWYRERNNG